MIDLAHPKEAGELFGHAAAEGQLLEAYNSANLAHSWLITGEKGIGKATLAYRFAKFLLKNGKPSIDDGGGLFGDALPAIAPENLDVQADDSVAIRVEQGSHADILVIEPEEGKTEITIDRVRKIERFFAHTPSESDYRIVIIDSADEMNRNAANALLKSLEEPPKDAILLLVCHCSGRILPTIRSRCRFLRMKPLGADVVSDILAKIAPDIDSIDASFAAKLSGGSVGLAASIYANNGLKLYEEILAIIGSLPNLDVNAIYKLGDAIAKKENHEKWQLVVYLFGVLLSRAVNKAVTKAGNSSLVQGENEVMDYLLGHYPVDYLAVLWEKTEQLAAQGLALNQDKRAIVTSIFAELMKKAG